MSPRAKAGRPQLFSNAGLVLLAVAGHKDHRVRHLASVVGITERNVAYHLRDLEQAGALTRRRDGRSSSYTLNLEWVDEETSIPLGALVDCMTQATR